MASASDPAEDGARGSTGTVARVMALLGCFAEGPTELTLSELADRVELPRSTTHRLLRLLRVRGFVEIDEENRRYSAGTELYRIAALLTAKMPLVQVALPVLRSIVDACDETALLSLYLRDRHAAMFAAKVDSTKPVRYVIDLNVPQSLLWGPSGRAILASLDEPAIERVIRANGNAPSTDGHRLDRRALNEDLEAIRRSGYAASRGERVPNAVGIAAPFFHADRSVAGAVALAIPEFRFDSRARARFVALVRDGADRVSAALGYPGAAGAAAALGSAESTRRSPPRKRVR
jgi:IclR family acetate operon transcriptional repressor